MKKSSITAQVFVLMAAILWGTTGSAQAFAPGSATPMVIGALRMAIGGTVLIILALVKGSFKAKVCIDKKLLLTASICMAMYQPLFFSGVSKTGIALGTVLALGSAPIFSGTMEYFVDKQISYRWIMATMVSITGCILLFSGQDLVDMNVLGSIFSLGAGLSYAVYARTSRKLFQTYSRQAINGLVFSISALILSPILLINDLSWVMSTRGIIVALHLGVITTGLGYTLFAHGLVNTSTPKAVTLTLAEPLTAAVLGVFVFNEKLKFISLMGVFFLFCGLIINSLPEREDIKQWEQTRN